MTTGRHGLPGYFPPTFCRSRTCRCCAGTLEDSATRHPPTAELVVEVAVSSVTPDRENATLSAEAGVAESWIVLGEVGQVEVYRQPQAGAYRLRRLYARGESIEEVAVLGGGTLAVETLSA